MLHGSVSVMLQFFTTFPLLIFAELWQCVSFVFLDEAAVEDPWKFADGFWLALPQRPWTIYAPISL
jgi:hypothetical protein